MKTRAGMRKMLTDLVADNDLSEEIAGKLLEAVNDYDYALGVMSEIGDVPAEEDVMDFEFNKRENPDWEKKYNELKRQYTERFFCAPPITTPEKVVEKAEEDAIRDSEDMTFDELLTKREG